MNQLTEFQQRAATLAVVKMLGGKNFSICDLDALAETMGRKSYMGGVDYAALRGIHCMDWADMGPELARMTREKCLELLGLPPTVVDLVKPVAADEEARTSQRDAEPAHKPAARLRLAFWR